MKKDTYQTGDWRDTIWNCLDERFPVKFEEGTTKRLCQYFTPRHIIDMMYYKVYDSKDPSGANKTQLDLCCGSGNILIVSFLNKSFDYPNEPTSKILSTFYGNELDPKMVDICRKRFIWTAMTIAQIKGEPKSNLKMYMDIVNKHIHCGDAFNSMCGQEFDSYVGFDGKTSTAFINTEKGIYGWQQNMNKSVPYLFRYSEADEKLPKMPIVEVYEALKKEIRIKTT